MVAVTVGRQPEIGEGQKVVREIAGRKLLLTRHRGELFCLDAHCFHMGFPLVDGDMEDVGGVHPCIICPAHRYRIDMRTGHKVDTDLCGGICASKDQKQRLYKVFTDGDKIQVYIPDAPRQEPPLPSDKYNFWTVEQQAMHTPAARQGFGLFDTPAAVHEQPPTPPHPEPYGGGIVLSQSPPAEGAQPVPAQQQQPQRVRGQAMQSHIQFRSARARQAILQNYKPPPMAEPPQPRGLFGTQGGGPAAAPTRQQQQPAASGQRTLQELWGRQQPAPVATGPQDMEMD